MNRLRKFLLLAALLSSAALCAGSLEGLQRGLATQGVVAPWQGFALGEALRYKLIWPSGVSLGEALLAVSPADNGVRFELSVEADLPIHNIIDSLTSVATPDALCSLQSQKKIQEGAKKTAESIEFDQKAHQARRTSGGQTASFPIPDCARDPLTFLYYFRSQLAAGSPANLHTFYSVTGHSLEVKALGPETVSAGGRRRPADKYFVTYHRPNSAVTFEVWFSEDARREPLLIRLSTTLAVFSAELQ